MPPSFYNTPGSTRNPFVEPPSILARVLAGLPSGLAVPMQRLSDRHGVISLAAAQAKVRRSFRHAQRTWTLRRLLSLPHLFVALWVLVLLWGERWVFQRSIAECQWDSWEKWVRSLAQCAHGKCSLCYSPKMQRLIIWSSSPTLNSSIRILILIGLGPSRRSRFCIRIITSSAPISRCRRTCSQIRCSFSETSLTEAENGKRTEEILQTPDGRRACGRQMNDRTLNLGAGSMGRISGCASTTDLARSSTSSGT